MPMRIRMPTSEEVTTVIGCLGLLAVIFPFTRTLTGTVLVNPTSFVVAIGILGLMFFYALVRGILRHTDSSALIFGILGFVSLYLGEYLLQSSLLTFVSLLCIVLSAAWNLLMQAPPKHELTEAQEPPSIQKFFDSVGPQ